ncbi:MAG: dipeptidyl peptidase 3 [Prevotellaceae bacterium]|jgi:dipeptidyl-peptidase-3|nr:dipeptidyl peptidase 3 [Prevotellaceae bacterium]
MKKIVFFLMGTILTGACQSGGQRSAGDENFSYSVEKFADLEILRYRVPGFEQLTLQQKKLVYFLSQAALEGRDIHFDQQGKHNLAIRRTLEAIYRSYAGDTAAADYKNLVVYLKRVWFASGIHHHYAADKFSPEFSPEYFTEVVKSLDPSFLPLQQGQTVDELLSVIVPVMFDPAVDAKRINQADGQDLITTSANNFYGNLTQKEAESFYGNLKKTATSTPISYGLNSRLVKKDGKIVEEVWKVGGLYSEAIEKIVYWLEKAVQVAETEGQQKVIEALVRFYQTGKLEVFDEYSILWVADASQVDFINGFIETYGDPLGFKGTWEAMVNFKNLEATKRTEIISSNAQWFEDNSPVDKRFKKEVVKGVSAKVITAAMLGGDCYPATPIGINLPNANWIRTLHGSKSVTIENITDAYDKAAQGNGFAQEFYRSQNEVELMRDYGFITGNMHTDLHECLGHASGKLMPSVGQGALKADGSAIEEARADLFGLYYIADAKMVELGLLPNDSAYKAEYIKFMTNGLLTQLVRIQPGSSLEEAHMRNRQLIARWTLEKGAPDGVVELRVQDGKTYVAINDYGKLRTLFGRLLAEIQRIRSEGDYAAAKNMVETYGVKVDAGLHNEILARYKTLNIAPYKGFVNPVYEVVADKSGEIADIKVTYSEGYAEQMLRYSKDHSWVNR